MIYDIVRKLPEGAQIVLDSSGDRAVADDPRRHVALLAADLPESDFPDLAAGDMTHKFTLAAQPISSA